MADALFEGDLHGDAVLLRFLCELFVSLAGEGTDALSLSDRQVSLTGFGVDPVVLNRPIGDLLRGALTLALRFPLLALGSGLSLGRNDGQVGVRFGKVRFGFEEPFGFVVDRRHVLGGERRRVRVCIYPRFFGGRIFRGCVNTLFLSLFYSLFYSLFGGSFVPGFRGLSYRGRGDFSTGGHGTFVTHCAFLKGVTIIKWGSFVTGLINLPYGGFLRGGRKSIKVESKKARAADLLLTRNEPRLFELANRFSNEFRVHSGNSGEFFSRRVALPGLLVEEEGNGLQHVDLSSIGHAGCPHGEHLSIAHDVPQSRKSGERSALGMPVTRETSTTRRNGIRPFRTHSAIACRVRLPPSFWANFS